MKMQTECSLLKILKMFDECVFQILAANTVNDLSVRCRNKKHIASN